MSRLNVVAPGQAAGKTRELYEAIKHAVGGVPNIYQGVANSAPALEAVLHVGALLEKGQLGAGRKSRP